eukprot:c3133_g1_i1 orf=554-1603(-)
MAGIMSPPSSFNIILQKGLAAHVERSSLASPAIPSGLHASTPMQPTSIMAGYASDQSAYGMGSGTHATPPIPGSTDAGFNSSGMKQGKKKRGRPRKYAPDVSVALALASNSAAATSEPASPSQKKGRGQPPGVGKIEQLAALGTAGAGFTPHVITIAAGEDIAMKVMSLSQIGPRAVCILSANGAISNVRLQQPATSGGTITYEGHFEILSLSGSFFPTKNFCVSSRTGGLSVSLAGPDGQVVGGGVAGLLMAASPVQMVVGSFLSSVKKSQVKPAKAEGLQKSQGANPDAVVVATQPLTQETTVANADSPLTSTEAHQINAFSNVARSFTSLLEVGNNTDINISLSGG